MTGPNYALEKYDTIPVNFPNNLFVLRGLQTVFCNELNPDNPCYACGSGGLGFEGGPNRYFAGPGSFVWRSACDGPGESSDINSMWAPYTYIPHIKMYMLPHELLKGTCSYIGLTLPPEIDPNFIKTSFIDVLKNPDYTETLKPWLYGTSQKWIPLCWESENYIGNICGISGFSGAICFVGSDAETADNEVTYQCDPALGVAFSTTPVTCGLVACCPADGD